jgi:hypothetical protein
MQERGSKRIVYSGISAALVVLSLYGGTIIVNNKIFFFAFATFIQSIPYITGGIAAGITSFVASAILSLILVPNKLYAGAYAFFGIYPLIKLIAERRKIAIEFIIKYVWFNITVVVGYMIFKNFINLRGIFSGIRGLIIIFILLQIAFLIYDYVFTKFVMFLEDRKILR